jgi:hypothetical protein
MGDCETLYGRILNHPSVKLTLSGHSHRVGLYCFDLTKTYRVVEHGTGLPQIVKVARGGKTKGIHPEGRPSRQLPSAMNIFLSDFQKRWVELSKNVELLNEYTTTHPNIELKGVNVEGLNLDGAIFNGGTFDAGDCEAKKDPEGKMPSWFKNDPVYPGGCEVKKNPALEEFVQKRKRMISDVSSWEIRRHKDKGEIPDFEWRMANWPIEFANSTVKQKRKER